ncbi:probable polygalacturonase [Musa acuminata AAA Group]|uniref:probable polygalacturonase n=1 Tax=Musa acuminata AAA Group TaxID=214697 RepID=UPI0031DDCFFD
MEHSQPIFRVLMILVLWTVVTAAFIGIAEGHRHHRRAGGATELEAFHYAAAGARGCRAHVASLTDFGGVGDGVTSNTAAFAVAVANLSKVVYDDGAMLVVPAGRWLTGPFNLADHFTLFLDHDAVILATQVLMILVLWTVVTAAYIGIAEGHHHHRRAGGAAELEAFHYAAAGAGGCRAHVASLTDFGGVGDGVTSNTAAFAAAVANLSKVAYDGGAMLVVPAGQWLTGPFNLADHFTLFLDHDAVILATQDINEWLIIDPLPSYGRGRDAAGGRYSNLIMGYNLTDVVITGNNGTIDGQRESWWKMFGNKELNYTRGYLIELMYCKQVLISNITLVNSPSWNVHPVYSSHVIVSGITILAPVNSPNTDGIDPDSSSNVRIEDCYIVSGDDCIAIKSGWDEYGIAFNMIKTTIGRGAYVKDIFVRRMNLHTMKWVFWMTGTYGQHPDDKFDPKAIPVVQNISYSNVVAENVTMAAKLEGIPGAPFTGICIYNVTAEVVKSKKPIWNCTDVEGVSSHVTPTPCAQIPEYPDRITHCPFPEDDLPVNGVGLEECAYQRAKP